MSHPPFPVEKFARYDGWASVRTWVMTISNYRNKSELKKSSKTKSDHKNVKRSKFFYALLFGWASARTFAMTILICTDQKTKTDH